MRQPRFSIVVPTRNRASLLPFAVRSALSQEYDDFELIVVNNASSDGTAIALKQFDDRRLRIVHSDIARLMHDNWTFALSHARGQFVLFLCDDDAWHPRLLRTVDQAISTTGAEVACWRSITHYSADWFEPARRGGVDFGPPLTDALFDIDAGALLDAAFDMRITITDIVPRMLNAAVSADLIRRLAEQKVRLFRPCNPDYSCLVAMATAARRMIYLDAPLLVSGATPASVGASASQRGESAKRFLDELLAHEPKLLLPPPPRTPAVWIGQTYAQCAQEIPALSGRNVNRVHMYGLAGLEIARFAARAEVADWQSEFGRVLTGPLVAQSDDIRAFVAQKRSIETDRFLSPTADQAALGCGPRLVAGLSALEIGETTIDQVALELDTWLERDGTPLANLWDTCAERCGARLCIVVGLGLNGRAILRKPPAPSHPLHRRLLSFDDYNDHIPKAAARIDDFRALDPRRHFALITPTSADGLVARLRQRGFSTSDMMMLASAAQSRSDPSPIRPVAAGTPLGCR